MMAEGIISESRVNTGRQREVDLLKAYSIIMMIITHCIDELFDYSGHLPSVIIDDILAQSVGAQGFMICMGIGLIYSRKGTPKDYLYRGVNLLIIGQILNLIRYALPDMILYAATGDIIYKAWCFLVFSSDILQFAGLFFIAMAVFGRFSLKPWHILCIAAAANIFGMLIAGRIETGVYALDQFIGLFIFTDSESYFPLLHWMIFPAFGMVFGDVLQHVKDKKRFYSLLFIPSALMFVIYYYIGINIDQPFFRVFQEWQSVCHINIFDAAAELFCNSAVLCLCYYITVRLTDGAMKPIEFISKNINRYYCVHSVMIYFAMCALDMTIGGKIESAAGCYITALIIIAATSAVVWVYDRYLAKSWRGFFGEHIYAWYSLVIILSILVCVWASQGVTEFPNLMNDYLE